MSAASALRQAIRRVRPTVRQDGRNLVRWMARHRPTRALLNAFYSALGYEGKETFHNAFTYLFRGRHDTVTPGAWTVRFAGRKLRLPFRGRDPWLEWDAATAALGHDVAVKRTYEALLSGHAKPRVFFDVGTNVGLHSLIFLVHGVRTVSFEPNPGCHEFIRAICDANGVQPDIRPVALGEREGEVELAFPPGETWLGTSATVVRDQLSSRGPLEKVRVRLMTLDRFCEAEGLRPDLIKVDTEGNERAVLEGARETLRSARPVVIFETWPGKDRDLLYGFMENIGYRIAGLPMTTRDAPGMERSRFLSSPETNFAALPDDRNDR
jgi:FkbM family methyltransferase